MRPVLVGIAPSRPGAEGQPLSSLGGRSTGATLARMAGLSWSDYLRRFDRVNLCPTVRPSTIAVREGRPMAEMLAGSLLRGRRVVLLGANVAECFGLDPAGGFARPCHWYEPPDFVPNIGIAGFKSGFRLPFTYAVLPHPSGRNRWYNDPENRASAERLMRNLAGSTDDPWGPASTGAALSFDDGVLNLDRGRGGSLAFRDEVLDWEDEYRVAALPRSEVLAIRDFLNTYFPPEA